MIEAITYGKKVANLYKKKLGVKECLDRIGNVVGNMPNTGEYKYAKISNCKFINNWYKTIGTWDPGLYGEFRISEPDTVNATIKFYKSRLAKFFGIGKKVKVSTSKSIGPQCVPGLRTFDEGVDVNAYSDAELSKEIKNTIAKRLNLNF